MRVCCDRESEALPTTAAACGREYLPRRPAAVVAQAQRRSSAHRDRLTGAARHSRAGGWNGNREASDASPAAMRPTAPSPAAVHRNTDGHARAVQSSLPARLHGWRASPAAPTAAAHWLCTVAGRTALPRVHRAQHRVRSMRTATAVLRIELRLLRQAASLRGTGPERRRWRGGLGGAHSRRAFDNRYI